MLKHQEKLFAEEYIINKGNAYQAAIAAGYSISTARNAEYWLTETRTNKDKTKPLPFKPELKEYIDKRLEKIESDKIATSDELLRYYTSVLRGESKSEIVVVEGIGDGCSEARRITKAPDEKEKLKAADSLSKIFGISKDKLDITTNQVVMVESVPEDW